MGLFPRFFTGARGAPGSAGVDMSLLQRRVRSRLSPPAESLRSFGPWGGRRALVEGERGTGCLEGAVVAWYYDRRYWIRCKRCISPSSLCSLNTYLLDT